MTNAIMKTRLALMMPLFLCAAFAGTSIQAMAAENMPAAMTPSGPASTKMTEARTPEARVKHDELKITPAQETQWNNVAHVMLANASAIDSAVKERMRMSTGMSAIDDLKSYETIVDAHADGIKKLAIAFAPLYAAVPESQQKNADAVFGHRTQPSKLKTHG
jgi:periplasmic protein CpxP/Spy